MDSADAERFWRETHDDLEHNASAYIDASAAYDALDADEAFGWLSAVDSGDASIELAAILYSFGIDDPSEIVTDGDNGIIVEGGEWVMYVEHSEGGYARIELGDANGALPEWVWDDWYEFADLFDLDWDMTYVEV